MTWVTNDHKYDDHMTSNKLFLTLAMQYVFLYVFGVKELIYDQRFTREREGGCLGHNGPAIQKSI